MAADAVGLRRAVLVASLLDDVPVVAADDGAVLTAPCSAAGTEQWPASSAAAPVRVPWPRLSLALAGAAPESTPGRLRLRDHLLARHEVARLCHLAGTDDVAAAVRESVVPLALPTGHALHPGPAWACERVLGGVLDLGPGLRLPGPAGAPVAGRVVALPLDVLTGTAAGAAPAAAPWWPPLAERLDELGALGVARLQRDGTTVITPIGGCDALTLLGSARLRRHLAGGDGVGMRSVGAPMRTRAWFDLGRIDPAFVGAAATATDPEHRGVDRPLLVTADEVAMARSASAPGPSHLDVAEGRSSPSARQRSLRAARSNR